MSTKLSFGSRIQISPVSLDSSRRYSWQNRNNAGCAGREWSTGFAGNDIGKSSIEFVDTLTEISAETFDGLFPDSRGAEVASEPVLEVFAIEDIEATLELCL